jgi:hypothetical protein
MREKLVGGRLPSGRFRADDDWWQTMTLGLNLNSVMKHSFLGRARVAKRFNAIRCWLIHVPGRAVYSGCHCRIAL